MNILPALSSESKKQHYSFIFLYICLSILQCPKNQMCIRDSYVAEIVRSGIMSVDEGQFEAGRSLGLNYSQTMRLIILPQAFKNVLPALANEFITLLKETSISGYIAIPDLTKGGEDVYKRQRIQEGFLTEEADPQEILSNNLKQMKQMTATTYQALYSAMKREQGTLEEDSGEAAEEDAAASEAVDGVDAADSKVAAGGVTEEADGEKETEQVDYRDFDIFKACLLYTSSDTTGQIYYDCIL